MKDRHIYQIATSLPDLENQLKRTAYYIELSGDEDLALTIQEIRDKIETIKLKLNGQM